MNREYRQIKSEVLGRPIELLVYGTQGKPIMVFPSQEGRFFDYENFGMIDVVAPLIEEGKIQVYCVDSIDHETWFSDASLASRVKRADDYDASIVDDVIPHIIQDGHKGAGVLAHGCSFGAFHTANFLLRHPEIFDSGIALSGCYNIDFTMDGFRNDEAFAHNPIYYSPALTNEKIRQLKEDLFVVCAGQGPWEEWNSEAIQMCKSLHDTNLPVLLDLWGYDVNHDWPWWKKMIIHFLGKFDRSGFLTSNHRMDSSQSRKFLEDFHFI